MMKKIFLSILIATVALGSFAQDLKNPGYRAKSLTYKFNKEKEKMPMKGYYILNNGTEIEAIIAYQLPEFFIGDIMPNVNMAPEVSLFICKELKNEPVQPFNPSDPNHKEFIKKSDIKAFFIDGHLYANIKGVGWRIVLSEGAIHEYISVVKMKVNNKISYPSFRVTQWFQGEPLGSMIGSISDERLEKLLAKNPVDVEKGTTPEEVRIGYKAGEYSLAQAVVRYNIWYNKHNAIQPIDYILGINGLNKAESALVAAEEAEKQAAIERAAALAAEKEALAAEKKVLEEAKRNAVKAPKQDYFGGRPGTVAAAYASVSPEVKIKKEKFKARIDRIKADGNKVGIVLDCSNVNVNPKSHTYFKGQTRMKVYGSYAPIVGIETIATKTAAQLNEGFGTDVFEVVDIKNIPVKTNSNGKKVDDWWSTKYKVVIFLNYNAYYSAYIQTTEDSTGVKKEFKSQMFVKSMCIMEAAEDGQKRMKKAGKAPKISAYSTDPYVADGDTKIYMIQDLKAVVNPSSDEEIVNHLMNAQEKYNAKFIKKYNK